MPLCETCDRLFRETVFDASLYGSAAEYVLHSGLSQFLLAVQSKCAICLRIFQLFSMEGRQVLQRLGSTQEDHETELVILRPLIFGFEEEDGPQNRELIVSVDINKSHFDNIRDACGVSIPSSVDADLSRMALELARYNMVGSNLFMAPKSSTGMRVSSCFVLIYLPYAFS